MLYCHIITYYSYIILYALLFQVLTSEKHGLDTYKLLSYWAIGTLVYHLPNTSCNTAYKGLELSAMLLWMKTCIPFPCVTSFKSYITWECRFKLYRISSHDHNRSIVHQSYFTCRMTPATQGRYTGTSIGLLVCFSCINHNNSTTHYE